jgi:hypothetical protein
MNSSVIDVNKDIAANLIGYTKKLDAVYYAGFVDLGHFYIIINDEA